MPKPPSPEVARIWAPIAEALAGLAYGAVEIVVHNGRIVQIERREKFRFEGGAQVPELRPPGSTPD